MSFSRVMGTESPRRRRKSAARRCCWRPGNAELNAVGILVDKTGGAQADSQDAVREDRCEKLLTLVPRPVPARGRRSG